MTAAIQPSPAERSADPLAAIGRNATPAPPSGTRFADLLQRGQATHGALATPASKAPATPAEGLPQPPPDTAADAAAAAPASPALPLTSRAALAKALGRPMPPLREPAAASMRPVAALPGADSSPSVIETVAAESGAAPLPTEGLVAAVTPPPAALVGWLPVLDGADRAAAPAQAEDTSAATATPGADRPAARVGSAPGGNSPFEPHANDTQLTDPARGVWAAAVGATEFLAPANPSAADPRPARTEARLAGDPLAGPFAGAVGALSRGADQPAPAPFTLATRVESPAFAQALGAQVSVFARDGVQRAELHLNPAELGPISVQIEIVGQQARVDFGANMPATREIIERGLPELASALREQGFTLAGGGVFQHAPESRRPPTGDAAGGTRKAVTGDNASPRTFVQRAPQGMLDLYA